MRWLNLLTLFSLSFSFVLGATAAPKTLQRPVAKSFGDLYVEYNGRICPMSTLAADVCTELFGQPWYKAEDGTYYTANQVLTGIFFYYDDWKEIPFRHSRKETRNATRKRIFHQVGNGSMLRIWPSSENWHDVSRPGKENEMSEDEWRFRSYAMHYLAYDLLQGKNIEADEIIKKIRRYQQHASLQTLPSERQVRVEQWFTLFPYTRPLAIACFMLALACLVIRYRNKFAAHIFGLTSSIVAFTFLSIMLGVRWYITGHIPMTTGHETMQTLAWAALLVAIFLSRHRASAYLSAGLALLVSGMSISHPELAEMSPALRSPLLSVHVGTIMLSYALFMVAMLNSVVAFWGNAQQQSSRKEQSLSLLLPATVFLLLGIILGSIWAKQAWGTYWNWDPKETWALITLLIYLVPVCCRNTRLFLKDIVYHIYCTLAFVSVLFTYFGVNYLLGGLHSYV